MVKDSFGEKLKKLRTSKGWSQSETSEKIGISLRYYQSIEADQKEPGFQILQSIQSAFGFEPLLTRHESAKFITSDEATTQILEITEGLREDQKAMIEEITRLNDEIEFKRQMIQKTFKLPEGLLALLVKASPALLRDVEQFLRSRGLQQDSLRKSK